MFLSLPSQRQVEPGGSPVGIFSCQVTKLSWTPSQIFIVFLHKDFGNFIIN